MNDIQGLESEVSGSGVTSVFHPHLIWTATCNFMGAHFGPFRKQPVGLLTLSMYK